MELGIIIMKGVVVVLVVMLVVEVVVAVVVVVFVVVLVVVLRVISSTGGSRQLQSLAGIFTQGLKR
jgi:hypothetical protein